MADCWELLFTGLESFLSLSCARETNATVSVAEATLVRLKGYLNVLVTIITTLKEASHEFQCSNVMIHSFLLGVVHTPVTVLFH